VKEGQRIGRVGNSGNTSEPHLHIHAERDGAGVPLRFDGRFPVRNDLVR
jgi:murein DD-endopeptidase MepM/ murein hydrolase activator NlpD